MLPVDLALSNDGVWMWVIAAGNAMIPGRRQMYLYARSTFNRGTGCASLRKRFNTASDK